MIDNDNYGFACRNGRGCVHALAGANGVGCEVMCELPVLAGRAGLVG